jgi:hypothetical protein
MTRCASCPGVAHEATGCQWSPSVLICHACAVRFWAWVRQHTKPRKGSDFYGAATRWQQQPPPSGVVG